MTESKSKRKRSAGGRESANVVDYKAAINLLVTCDVAAPTAREAQSAAKKWMKESGFKFDPDTYHQALQQILDEVRDTQ